MTAKQFLTDKEKIQIISMVNELGHEWKVISEKIGRPYETEYYQIC